MIDPSNLNEELERARTRIKSRLSMAMTQILEEEISKAMGRVKIMITSDLKGEWAWWIESGSQPAEKRDK